ncbi:maleylpyruvate isomerase N-terminal domain-containing protein [Nocardioides KLBMP 9356]|uniref:Maleylpyruvate isomerase N-terminal domain-containing protein n=1 Tax=Nocardioides potassii TaxID=2911371 RepID=A0ABS9HDT5_9ACTN|nr:maleylpyruvate isomerase N-terminal domain-containing protein [Nocardioides potassii]MCF6378364.1 maleylpyruvate isomerase N-terminal domain-containing protein [Nocardioides potassii]
MAHPWEDSCRAFAEAADWFVATAARVDRSWSSPGLGEWDLRSLVGHTSRSLLTVEAYLARPAASVDVPSSVAYFEVTRELANGPGVADRGRDAGTALGDDPAASVAGIASRVLPLVAACSGDEVIETIAGGMRLSDYLPTRTFELVAHTVDLCWALDLPADPPAEPASVALELVAALAASGGLAGPLLRGSLGRGPLPEGFSVL